MRRLINRNSIEIQWGFDGNLRFRKNNKYDGRYQLPLPKWGLFGNFWVRKDFVLIEVIASKRSISVETHYVCGFI